MITNIYNSLNNASRYYLGAKTMPKKRSFTSSQPSITEPLNKEPNLTHTSWFYINDIHGKMTKMERIYVIAQKFDRTSPFSWDFFKNSKNEKVSKFKVSSGDISIGCNPNNNKVAYKFLQWCGFNATELGNHEMDVVEPGDLASLIDNTNCNMLALNVEVEKDSPLYGKFKKSIITENNGEKVGIIGIAPSDMFLRVKMSNSLNSIKVKEIDESIKLIQQEVDNLRKQGINKIALLSHSGIDNDKKIAQMVDGIDIIFGGHTHNLIKDIKEGENLFYSKSGEPIIITQAGKNGENVGILNVDFDENGVIKRAQNNIIPTESYSRRFI